MTVNVRPGERVRFIEPTRHRFVRVGVIDRIVTKGTRKGALVITTSDGRHHTVDAGAVRGVAPR